jgi:curved DNA-binding protein CbpA
MPPVVRAQLDYYAVLEIAPSADAADVNAAFRRLAWRYHPDRNPAPGATLQFQDINEAHQVLSDPARRAEYDAQWQPHVDEHRRPLRTPVRHHVHRRWHRHRHVRAALLTLIAVLFVSSAWAVIFTAMTVVHSGGFDFDRASEFTAGVSPDCGFSMEMFPVTHTDEHGRRATAWETSVHNCWGGSTRVFSLPDLHQSSPSRFPSFSAYH